MDIKNRRKTSKIWTMPKKELQLFCDNCDSIRELLMTLGYCASSGTMFYIIKQRIKKDNIDISHFNLRQGEKCGKIPLEKILVKNSLYNRCHLKKRLIDSGLLKYICAKCDNEGEWESKSLVLELEHKNGDPTDNRIKNLEFLCPNCHSQTKTYCGRKNSRG